MGENVIEKKKSNKGLIFVVATLVVVVVAVICVVVMAGSPSAKMKQALNLGERYLEEMDYESAMAQFAVAISIDPNNAETQATVDEYINKLIGEAYELVEAGDYDGAVNIANIILSYFPDNENAEKLIKDVERRENCSKGSHLWKARTVEAPKTCEICGVTEGEAVKLTVIEVEVPKGDSNCTPYDGGYFVNNWPEGAYANNIWVYEEDGTLINELTAYYDYESIGYGCWYYGVDGVPYIVTFGMDGYSKPNTWGVIDANGNVLWNGGPGYVIDNLFSMDGDLCVAGYQGEDIVCINTVTGAEVEYKGEVIDFERLDASGTKWNSISRPGWNKYYIAEEKSGEWSLIDDDLNLVKTYADVTSFNKYGFALATDDRKSYYLIDEDLNVVAENIAQGSNSQLMWEPEIFFRVTGGDGIVYLIYAE